MASTGAQCDHVNHVSTQLPYAFTVAGVCAVGYLLAGTLHHFFDLSNLALNIIVTGFSIILMLAVLFIIRSMVNKEPAAEKAANKNKK
jgi:Na+/H+ antiporter NhaC